VGGSKSMTIRQPIWQNRTTVGNL